MYTRNSQSAVTSDEDRGDKSTLPREVSSEKKKEKKKSARACRCCFRSLPLFKHRTRYTCLSFLLPLPPIFSLFHENQANLIFRLEKKKKKMDIGYRKWVCPCYNVNTEISQDVNKFSENNTRESVFTRTVYIYDT